jgi:hypothetical protein
VIYITVFSLYVMFIPTCFDIISRENIVICICAIVGCNKNNIKILDAYINPLNAELNPICHLLALLGGATIVVISRLRVKMTELFCSDIQSFERCMD